MGCDRLAAGLMCSPQKDTGGGLERVARPLSDQVRALELT